MTKTVNYQLNQWESTDKISRADFNSDNAAIDGLLAAAESRTAAAQATGDRGLDGLRKMMGDVCRLAYQADGKGIYTGFRQGFDFDGLNADHKVESTTGAAVLEPDNGQVRLAVDGWTGGTVAWDVSSLTIASKATQELLSTEFSPGGCGKLTTATLTAKVNSSGGGYVQAHMVLMCGEDELASTNTLNIDYYTSSLTFTFSTVTTLVPQKTYHLKLLIYNPINNSSETVKFSDNSSTLTATKVKNTEGTITLTALALGGTEIQAWVQYSEPGVVTMDMLKNGVWTSMEQVQECDSESPEGTACKERTFKLTLPEPIDSTQFRVNINSESECFVYGYGVVAL